MNLLQIEVQFRQPFLLFSHTFHLLKSYIFSCWKKHEQFILTCLESWKVLLFQAREIDKRSSKNIKEFIMLRAKLDIFKKSVPRYITLSNREVLFRVLKWIANRIRNLKKTIKFQGFLLVFETHQLYATISNFRIRHFHPTIKSITFFHKVLWSSHPIRWRDWAMPYIDHHEQNKGNALDLKVNSLKRFLAWSQ